MREGTLDHIITCSLVASRVTCFSIQALFSDHIALDLQYSLPSGPPLPDTRLRITIPPNLMPTFDFQSPEKLYFSLVGSTHEFYTRYMTRPHVKGHREAYLWTSDQRVLLAERKAVEDGLAFQRQLTPAHLTATSGPEMISLPFSNVPVLSPGGNTPTASIIRQPSAPRGT
ncbi:hypothetical protein E2C01_042912 [Portunus trituberculatus]|uniref:Uncharacterized protein n=1 Tax=Portunus trituberculatus TaxID=210409 RepID=A0A5B7FUW5_PORTR|nr:hypothetical protein [Portunus trituberculatus]